LFNVKFVLNPKGYGGEYWVYTLGKKMETDAERETKEAATDVGHEAKEAADKLKTGAKSVFNKLKGKA
jgi:hypothetical protein